MDLYSWGKWEKRIFHLCGIRYRQYKDFSVSMDQEEYTMSLNEANFRLPPDLNKQESTRRLDGMRAINGSLQWLITELLHGLHLVATSFTLVFINRHFLSSTYLAFVTRHDTTGSN